MSARLLDGRELASHLRRELQHRLERLVDPEAEGADAPCLAIVRDASSEPASVYAASLERAARSIGAAARIIDAEEAAAGAGLEATIAGLNADPMVAGIVIAQPFADAARGRRLVELIDPAKDVDGATPTNAGRLARGEPAFVPATALAVVAILEGYGVEVASRRAVVVGRSAVVGRPVASLLLARDATVVICHRATRNLARETRRAEILVAAAGQPGLIRPEMVNRSTVIVDCGINAVDGRIVGDVEFDAVAPVVRAISPVPGGVGTVTPMMVLRQTVESAERMRSTGHAAGHSGSASMSSSGTEPSMNPSRSIVS
ncbi:MAG TPA: bifunctional 5,10-methylenetetrahydrofolate dehydrogenase/5,10-methenyltetrahydrofolate cyclohydrolase [Candidatus Limnocylindria bacterium]|nr:bifunctional 5,10-methylenetetrahydrofolate dehydrogenase/5,10-methenyltetrahydrofolate cyclohydrolase [Candidatus Limnocylindria bacterium]